MAGPNILNFGSKVVFLNGLPLTLPVASSDPGTASAGDMYYNSVSQTIRYYNGSTWNAISSGGTVTSVALADGSITPIYSISGSPVTGSGTLTFTLNSQTANTFFAAPNGSAGQPGFRAIVPTDIPTLNQNTTGTAANITATSNSTLTSLSALTSASSLATVGTISSGTWQGTPVGILYGGTGATSAAAAFAALSPLTTAGDLIYENSVPAPARLPIGSTGYVLTVVGGLPAWAPTSTTGITQLTGDVTAGPGSGSQTATVVALQGNMVSSATPSDAQMLLWVSGTSKWTPESMSGDATLADTGALTLATVNSNVGSFGSSTAIPSFTVNAKGLITAASTSAVIAPAGTLTGTTLNSTVVNSSLTSLGTQAQNLNMGTFLINNVGTPLTSTDAATKGYVDSAINGLTWKGPVNAFAASNVPLTGGATLTVDGYSVQNGNFVILSNQTTASQNGVYVASGIGTAYTLTLATGAEAATALGDAYLVLDGTVYANSAYQVNQLTPNITFIQFAGPNTYNFMAPLSLSGNTVTLKYDNSTIQLNGSNQIYVNNAPAGTLTGTTLNSTVVNSSLTSVGTISSGTWQGSVIGLSYGGTGTASLTGVTGTGNIVASASPTLTGTIIAAAMTMSGILTTSQINSTGTLLFDVDGGAAALQVESLNFQRSTNGTNYVTETYTDSTTLTDNVSTTTAFQFAYASVAGQEICYVIESGDANQDCRVGTIRITANNSGTITPSISDMYSETADCGVTWNAALSGSNILIQYTTTNQGANRTMRADIKSFRR